MSPFENNEGRLSRFGQYFLVVPDQAPYLWKFNAKMSSRAFSCGSAEPAHFRRCLRGFLVLALVAVGCSSSTNNTHSSDSTDATSSTAATNVTSATTSGSSTTTNTTGSATTTTSTTSVGTVGTTTATGTTATGAGGAASTSTTDATTTTDSGTTVTSTSGGGTGGIPPEMDWVGAWSTAPQLTETSNNPPSPGLSDNTLRQVMFPTLGGSQIRVRFTNEFGNGPVTFNAVHIAKTSDGSSIDTATDQALTFDGMASVTINQGEAKYSDPLDFQLDALQKYSITIAFGSTPSDITGHPGSRTTSYLASGQMADAASLNGAATAEHWYYLGGIDVMAAGGGAIAILGDSITDGRGSTTDGNNRWPDDLARRLQSSSTHAGISVLNQGIGGNAVVSGGLGPTARDRFERDILNQAGVRWVIIFEGVNDIGGAGSSVADGIISAYQEFIEKAHARGLLIYGAPITPFGGSQYDSTDHESARTTVNDWIRTSGEFDAVIDLDEAVRDPNNQTHLQSSYDSGDGLHLSPAGLQAMADAIDLALFEP